MTWMTPFEAVTFGVTTVAAPFSLSLPPTSERAIFSPSSVVTLAFALAAAIAAGARICLPITW